MWVDHCIDKSQILFLPDISFYILKKAQKYRHWYLQWAPFCNFISSFMDCLQVFTNLLAVVYIKKSDCLV